MENMPGFMGQNFFFNEGPDPTLSSTWGTVTSEKPKSGLEVKGWVVMMHSPGVGTFAPTFTTLDEAEEFSNAMRILTTEVSVSEPVPVVKTQTIKVTARKES